MKKYLIYIGTLLAIIISFLIYFYCFTTTNISNLSLTVSYDFENTWETTGLQNGVEVPLTTVQAIDSTETVFLRRTIEEQWRYYETISVDTNRAVLVFVDDELIFANHPTDMTVPCEIPLMEPPTDLPFSTVFTFNPAWIGKTLTLVTRTYNNSPFASIEFEVRSNSVVAIQHEAWVTKQALPGAMFGLLSLFLIGLFLYQFATTKKGYPILFLVISSLLQMFSYMGPLSENPLPMIDSTLFPALFFLFPLLYLGTKLTNLKKAYFISTISIWSVYFVVFTATYILHLPLPYWFDKVDLLCFLLFGITIYCCFRERKANPFSRHFLSIISMFLTGYIFLFFATMVLNKPLNEYIIILFREASRLYCRPLLIWMFTTLLFSSFIIVIWDLLQERVNAAHEMERLESEQSLLNMQMQTANEQLTSLRTSQEQTVIYRHDMRHHLSLLINFAHDGDLEKITEYLAAAKTDIDALTPIRYCENETVNLILSSFHAKAQNNNVELCTQVSLPNELKINDTALCSLFSNALENAINAVTIFEKQALRKVHIEALIKNDYLLLSTRNAYEGTLQMDRDLPKTKNKEEGHGFGLKSILSVVKRYEGMYTLDTQGGEFVLRLAVPLK